MKKHMREDMKPYSNLIPLKKFDKKNPYQTTKDLNEDLTAKM